MNSYEKRRAEELESSMMCWMGVVFVVIMLVVIGMMG